MPLDGTNLETELKGLKELVAGHTETAKRLHDVATTEVKNLGTASAETKARADEALFKLGELAQRITEVEQKAARGGAYGADGEVERKSVGQRVVEAAEYKALAAMPGQRGRAVIEVKAITTGSGSGGELIVENRRPGIVELVPDRRLVVRDLITPGRTDSPTVEFVREAGFTNSAAVVAEAAAKPESGITFETSTAPARVIAHWIKASKQVLSDAPQLQGIIDGRLRYGLQLAEETELLYGDGTGQHLNGIATQAEAYSAPIDVDDATMLDNLRLAMLQAVIAEYPATGMVMNPRDWARIELTKTTDGAYLFANPQGQVGARLWGLPVVETPAITVDKFLIGAFRLGAQVWDRWQATVQISTEDQDNFIKNMVTILAEERLALTVYRPEAFVYGDFGNV